MKLHWQEAGEEIDVAGWPSDDEYATYPEGSRSKRLLRCPAPAPHPWLFGGHRYLFKESRRTYPAQFWVEIVAARIGQLCGVPVPPAYACWDSKTGTAAALIEWFYGYPSKPSQRFFSGGLLMKAAIKDFDHEKGRQHNFETINTWFQLAEAASGLVSRLSSSKILVLQPDWIPRWAAMLTFDALIGNTDRHQENWGLLFGLGSQPQVFLELAPAFDNGTSLGHELDQSAIAGFRKDDRRLAAYIGRGRHHLRWQLADTRQAGHLELLLQLSEKCPQSRPAMVSVLKVSDSQLDNAVLPLCDINLPVPLARDRAELMLRLLRARRDRLLERLTSLP